MENPNIGNDVSENYLELDYDDMVYRFAHFLKILGEADMKVFTDLANSPETEA